MTLIAFYACGFEDDFWAGRVQGQAGDTSIIISGLQENTIYLIYLFVYLFILRQGLTMYLRLALDL